MIAMKIKSQKEKKFVMYVIKRKLKFGDYGQCLEAIQLEIKWNKINQLGRNMGECIKKNKLIWKLQQRFRSVKKNIFTWEKHIHMEQAKMYYLNKKKLNVTK